MENGSKGLRERLLARLPQAENVAGYREETLSLLAKHERALFWERVSGRTVVWLGIGLFMFANSTWSRSLDSQIDSKVVIFFDVLAVVLFFTGALYLVSYQIDRSKVDLLKEVKQVQLQVLELQASLKKEGSK
jgi:type VI protein secretion system component VasF